MTDEFMSAGDHGNGASFVRVDLHVHLYGDSETDPKPDLEQYIASALENEISVMAVTDHNSISFVRDAVDTASDTGLYVLPGIEITTHDGHLIALYSPENIAALEELAAPSNLQLADVPTGGKRSKRSMLDLVESIGSGGGLPILAHIDASNGAAERLSPSEWKELLTSPALAGLEFTTKDALSRWFTDEDPDDGRRAAWHARSSLPNLRERGLARLMSSDSHSPTQVGRDRESRTLTRLRLDHVNFESIRNAIVEAPNARCKAEMILPPTYPRVVSASFEGGFLDGTSINFSENLTCFIGGRGSGKSTALLSVRAALGKHSIRENIDDPHRMPEKTIVKFIDTAGSNRTAIRIRGGEPLDPDGKPIHLRLADLGQEETARLARSYEGDPIQLLKFLDGFIVRHEIDEREENLLSRLADNENEIQRTQGARQAITKFEKQQGELEAQLNAAQAGKLDAMAEWAALLATQGPLIEAIEAKLAKSIELEGGDVTINLDELAISYGVDLTAPPIAKFVDGEAGVRLALEKFEKNRADIQAKTAEELTAVASGVENAIKLWKTERAELRKRFEQKRKELENKGLTVEAGALEKIATRLQTVRTSLVELRERKAEYDSAVKERKKLVAELHVNREKLHALRKATLKRIVNAANSHSSGLIIHLHFEPSGISDEWTSWLSSTFGFRKPRVDALASQIMPRDFAEKLTSETGRAELYELHDTNGSRFLADGSLDDSLTWDVVFRLQEMKLEDRARIEVQRVGESTRMRFDQLSAGQQHSVLLGLLLCAERPDPLIIDQPEDHLDGQYIAKTVVGYLEKAKERRQVVIATHSANLTVLGDAELVLPMSVESGVGMVTDAGAVDRPETRKRICDLLEGGIDAYMRRGRRYGLSFKPD